jgi:hypothetical protein
MKMCPAAKILITAINAADGIQSIASNPGQNMPLYIGDIRGADGGRRGFAMAGNTTAGSTAGWLPLRVLRRTAAL